MYFQYTYVCIHIRVFCAVEGDCLFLLFEGIYILSLSHMRIWLTQILFLKDLVYGLYIIYSIEHTYHIPSPSLKVTPSPYLRYIYLQHNAGPSSTITQVVSQNPIYRSRVSFISLYIFQYFHLLIGRRSVHSLICLEEWRMREWWMRVR